MNKFKTAAASVLAAAMILSLTACDEEPAVSGSNSGVSNADAPNADGTSGNNAPVSAVTTATFDTDPDVQEAAKNAADKIGLDVTSIDLFIPHQANIRIIETAAKNLGVSMDKFFTDIDLHGNTSSASIPVALNDAVERGVLKRGDKLCLVGFGAGLTMGSVITEY